jgi:hypothetical protein
MKRILSLLLSDLLTQSRSTLSTYRYDATQPSPTPRECKNRGSPAKDTLEETRKVAKRELEALQGRREELEELERDRDTLLEHYTQV